MQSTELEKIDSGINWVKNNIFCPIHWKQTNEIYKTLSEYGKSLSDNILSIPVDQRYSTDDIDRIIDVLMQYSLIENKG